MVSTARIPGTGTRVGRVGSTLSTITTTRTSMIRNSIFASFVRIKGKGYIVSLIAIELFGWQCNDLFVATVGQLEGYLAVAAGAATTGA